MRTEVHGCAVLLSGLVLDKVRLQSLAEPRDLIIPFHLSFSSWVLINVETNSIRILNYGFSFRVSLRDVLRFLFCQRNALAHLRSITVQPSICDDGNDKTDDEKDRLDGMQTGRLSNLEASAESPKLRNR